MATKGINTIIKETKDGIVTSVNQGIQKGLPMSVIELMLDSIMMEVRSATSDALAKEKASYEEELKIEAEQVKYVPPVESNDASVNEESTEEDN